MSIRKELTKAMTVYVVTLLISGGNGGLAFFATMMYIALS